MLDIIEARNREQTTSLWQTMATPNLLGCKYFAWAVKPFPQLSSSEVF